MENHQNMLYKTNTKSMRFSNSEKPIIPLGILDILGCRNRLPKVFENLQYLDVQRTFFMKNHQNMLYKTNTKSMRFSNSEKPIIPLGILDILGCRNRLPKVFENCNIWLAELFFHGNHQNMLYKPNKKSMRFRILKNLLFH